MTVPMPERPARLDEFAALVMADAVPSIVLIDRDLMRALLAYLWHLESERRA